VSSRALCPGSIYRLAPVLADGWIPATSAGMTTTSRIGNTLTNTPQERLERLATARINSASSWR
jgi:hypothetical protein